MQIVTTLAYASRRRTGCEAATSSTVGTTIWPGARPMTCALPPFRADHEGERGPAQQAERPDRVEEPVLIVLTIEAQRERGAAEPGVGQGADQADREPDEAEETELLGQQEPGQDQRAREDTSVHRLSICAIDGICG